MDEWVWSNGGMVLTGEIEVLEGNACSSATVHHQLYVEWPGIEHGSPPSMPATDRLFILVVYLVSDFI